MHSFSLTALVASWGRREHKIDKNCSGETRRDQCISSSDQFFDCFGCLWLDEMREMKTST